MKTNVTQLFFTFLLVLSTNLLWAQVLSYGDAVTGEISTEGQLDTYTFNGSAGDVILIRMRGKSGGVDGCMELFDPSGASIATDCDDGGLVQINGLTLAADGVYTLKANDSGDNDTGNYGLSLEVLNNPSGAVAIDCKTDLMEPLDHSAEVDAYRFEGRAGNRILIQMRSAESSLESQLELYDATGKKIADGVTAVGLTSISDFSLPTDGVYTILSMDKNGNDIGFYGLSLQFLDDLSCAESISCGMTLDSAIDFIAEIDAYTFKGKANDQILIQMNKQNTSMESVLELYDAKGDLVAADTPAGGQAKIDMSLPQDGEYLILVKDEKGNDTGGFTLSFQVLNNTDCAETFSCSQPSFTTKLEKEGEVDVYATELEAGSVLNVRMRGVLNGIDSYLKLYDASGTLLFEDYANGAMAEIVDFPITQTGMYTLTASDRSGNDTGEYGISLQVVPARLNCSVVLDCEATTFTTDLANFSEMDAYTFLGKERQILTVVMSEIDIALEPVLKLYAPDGSLIAEQRTSLHADFTGFVLPQDGLYTLMAMDKNGNDIGAYSITFTLDNENGTTTCATCDDGVQNGDETGIDCGGLNCADCCPAAGTACTICPDDITITCQVAETNLPTPVSVQGAGTYDMTFKFDGLVESIPGTCLFGNVTFDNGCVGVRTGCWSKKLKVTPQFETCGGPLPNLPFTVDFGSNLKVYFDIEGNPEVINQTNNSHLAAIDNWLNSATAAIDCEMESITNDYNENQFIAECTGSQVVTFKGIDACGNVSSCSATLTLTDGLLVCPTAGTACDDGNDVTLNDMEDGNCNCAGTEYCPSKGINTDYEYIDYVGTGPMENKSGNDGGYGNYTSMVDKRMLGEEFDLKLIPGFASEVYTENWAVWIDFNQDGDFEDAGEEVYTVTTTSDDLIVGQIKIPSDATLGITRMRIAMKFIDEGESETIDPCGEHGYGEVEDYSLNIIEFSCPVAGSACDDGDENTINETEDGNCNCIGEELVAEPCGTGTISRDVFRGVAGYPLTNIDWESAPDFSDEMDIFEIPINQYEHYGSRLRGYLCAPQTGEYTFWIASDDFGELWLSQDDSPDSKQLIAEVPGWTASREWDKYSKQKSMTIYLEKGKRYYVEAFMKEHEGLDNLAVGWLLPDGILERPIGGANLSPWDGPTVERIGNNNEITPSNGVLDLKIFPNPAIDVLTVDLSHFVGQQVEVSMTNNFGQVVYSQQIENVNESQMSINLRQAQMKNGYYNVSVRSAKQIIAKPLIISRGVE